MAANMKSTLKMNGMAMLMALVMLAIASTLAAYIWYDSQLTVSRISHLKQSYQAKHYAQGLLVWAGDILRNDYAQDENSHDSYADPWLQGIQGMVVEDAIISGELVGLNNRFNINNMVINDELKVEQIEFFRRLLLVLDMDVNIADKIIDWIDSNQLPEPNGAEDFIYRAKSPSYSTGSKHFQHIDELALLDGLTQADFQKLLPYVVAVPVQGLTPTKMNVNTMSPPLLKSLNSQITNDMALRLNQNKQANFSTMDQFFADNALKYVLVDTVSKNEIRLLAGVQTRELQASSMVQMDDQAFQMYALLRRDSFGEAMVLSRSSTPFDTSNLVR